MLDRHLRPRSGLTQVSIRPRTVQSDQRGIRTKVTSTTLSERHVFLWLDREGDGSAHYFVQHDEPPSRPPDLPSGLTDLWLASDSHMGWRWNASTSWTRFNR